MSSDVGEVTEWLENELCYDYNYELCSFSNLSVTSPTSQLIVIVIAKLILQPFRHFTHVTTLSPTLPSLYLHHSSFSNPSVASPCSQLILQPFCCFTYITAHSPTLLLLHLHHSSFSNPYFASTSQALHSRHLANRSCCVKVSRVVFEDFLRTSSENFVYKIA